MAVIPKPIAPGYNIDLIAPSGQYAAVCLDVVDTFGVERKKFQSEEVEIQDVTRFIFGIVDFNTNIPYLVQTFEFKISGGSGSNLIKFLTAWLGRAPSAGWDYCELKGTAALLSVEQTMSKSATPTPYAKITGTFPVPQQMLASVPQPEWFQQLIAQALAASGGQSPAQAAPVAQQPVAQQPPIPQQVIAPAQQPIVQQPMIPAQAAPMGQTMAPGQPVAQQPIAQQPIAQQPIAQQPIAQQPIAQQPVAQVAAPVGAPVAQADDPF